MEEGHREAPTSTTACSANPGAVPHATSGAMARDYSTIFTNLKAGMEGLSAQDKERIKRTVFEMSKDSAHGKNEQRKQAQVDAKIAGLRERAARLTDADMARNQRSVEQRVVQLEAGRDLTRTWVHVDMDAFFASVEELFNPALKHVPMAVGGIGMISTANYPARKFGVRSAMPGFIAKVLCPQLVFVSPNFDRYMEYSNQTRQVFKDFDAGFEAGSLDEAYLDVTEYCEKQGVTGAEVACELRRRVREETQLTCSCGVASNKMLAKICSDLQKPDGQFVLGSSREEVVTFINTLPVRKIPGIGRVTEQLLAAFGVHTCGDVMRHGGILAAIATPTLLDSVLTLGLGQTRHTPPLPDSDPHRKGISCERTFKVLSSKAELDAMATSLVQHLCDDMASEGIEGRCVTLKLKAATFEVRTRNVTLTRHASQPAEILPAVLKLLHAELPFSARLMGVRMSTLRKKGGKPPETLLTRYLRGAAQQQGQGQAQGQREGQQQELGHEQGQREGWRQEQLGQQQGQHRGRQGQQQEQGEQHGQQQGLQKGQLEEGQREGQQGQRWQGQDDFSTAEDEAGFDLDQDEGWGEDPQPGQQLPPCAWDGPGLSDGTCFLGQEGEVSPGVSLCRAEGKGDVGPREAEAAAPGAWLGNGAGATAGPPSGVEGYTYAQGAVGRQGSDGGRERGFAVNGAAQASRQARAAAAATAAAGEGQTAGLEATAASTSAPQPQQRGAQQGARGKEREHALWTCRACTFAENPMRILRCEVCDTLKGCEFGVGGSGRGGGGGVGRMDDGAGSAAAAAGGAKGRKGAEDGAAHAQKKAKLQHGEGASSRALMDRFVSRTQTR